jgi:acylphosphatase
LTWTKGPTLTDTQHADKPLCRSVRVRIEGRVQGVGFRAFVERAALGRGLNGFVRNRRDGGVEAVFSGAADAIDSMLVACHRGPPHSVVAFVKVIDETDTIANGFSVGATV